MTTLLNIASNEQLISQLVDNCITDVVDMHSDFLHEDGYLKDVGFPSRQSMTDAVVDHVCHIIPMMLLDDSDGIIQDDDVDAAKDYKDPLQQLIVALINAKIRNNSRLFQLNYVPK